MSAEPRVSEHAMLRYLERVYKLDLPKLREEILTSEVRTALKLGASAVNVGEFRYVLANNSVITVHPRRLKMKAEDVKRYPEGKRS